MHPAIEPGSVLVAEGTPLPAGMNTGSDSMFRNWHILTHVASGALEAKLNSEGWTMFYLAGAVKSSVWGFDSEQMTVRAVQHLLDGVVVDKHNCMEIDTVSTGSFLGITRIAVSAHARHIQERYRMDAVGAAVPRPFRLYM